MLDDPAPTRSHFWWGPGCPRTPETSEPACASTWGQVIEWTRLPPGRWAESPGARAHRGTARARAGLAIAATAPPAPRPRRPRGGAAATLAARPEGLWGRGGGGAAGPRAPAPASPVRPCPVPAGRGAPGEAWSPAAASGLHAAQPLGPHEARERRRWRLLTASPRRFWSWSVSREDRPWSLGRRRKEGRRAGATEQRARARRRLCRRSRRGPARMRTPWRGPGAPARRARRGSRVPEGELLAPAVCLPPPLSSRVAEPPLSYLDGTPFRARTVLILVWTRVILFPVSTACVFRETSVSPRIDWFGRDIARLSA